VLVPTTLLMTLPPMEYEGNLAENFRCWIQRYHIYISANGLDGDSDKRKINILLNFIGEKGIQIFNSSVVEVIQKFNEYFNPKRSLCIFRTEFFSISQNNMRLEDYFQKVINLGLSCEFAELRESLTVSKIISSLDSKFNNLKTKLISEEDSKLTLDYVMKFLLSAEASRRYVEHQGSFENTNKEEVFYANRTTKKPMSSSYINKTIRNCRNCSLTHDLNKCPAFDQICHKCNKPNHFAKVCRSRRMPRHQINMVQELEQGQREFFTGCVSTKVGNEIHEQPVM
jgi:hypothetical protein